MATHDSKKPHVAVKTRKESHPFHFRGCWLPARVFDLLTDGGENRLTATDLAILTMIDALTDPNGRGCFASNNYLGRKLGIKVRAVQYSIKHLIKLGLVARTVENRNERDLRVTWDTPGGYATRLHGGVCNGVAPEVISRSKKNTTVAHAPRAATVRGDATSSQYSPANKRSAARPTPRAAHPGHKARRPTRAPDEKRGQPSHQDMDMLGDVFDDSPPSDEAFAMAGRLHKALADEDRAGRWSRRGWASWMERTLRKYDNVRVLRALDWYIPHIAKGGKDYTPVAWSARAFYEKFTRIEAAMARDAERNPQVEISAEARRVVALVTQGQPLPAGARAELPAAVQLSLDALADLRRRILKAHPKCKAPVTGPRHLSMLAPEDRFPWLVQSRLGPSLVQHFFEGVAGWAAGKTNLRLIPKRVVSVDNEDFQKWGMGLAMEHGNAHHWTRLMKEVGR